MVMNEAQFSEFVHEETDPRARCANHFCQHLLRYFGKHQERSQERRRSHYLANMSNTKHPARVSCRYYGYYLFRASGLDTGRIISRFWCRRFNPYGV
jgi:hypothetical protein